MIPILKATGACQVCGGEVEAGPENAAVEAATGRPACKTCIDLALGIAHGVAYAGRRSRLARLFVANVGPQPRRRFSRFDEPGK